MTYSNGKHNFSFSRMGAILGVVAGILTLITGVVGVGVIYGTVQSVNAEQTKQIDSLNIDIKNVVTKDDFKVFKEDIKGLLQTYTSQITKMQ